MVVAQEPAAATAKKPADVFRESRDILRSGNQELAAELLKDFFALKPTDQDYLNLETKYGPTTFQGLRNVPRWFADAKRDAEFKATTLEGIVQASLTANEKLLRDPKRIAKFVLNLGASTEERDFAIAELKRSGDAVVPYLVDNIRTDSDPAFRAGAMLAVTQLGSDTIPGLLIAAESTPDDIQSSLLQAIAKRSDIISLIGKTDTNIMPLLWYLASTPGDTATLRRDNAINLLRGLTGDNYERRQPVAELVKLSEPLYAHKSQFAGLDTVKNRVKLWSYDVKTKTMATSEITLREAEERYGLKYLRWAIERNPTDEVAQERFLSIATERAVERAKFADLAKAEPEVYALLASAPSTTLVNILENALLENRTALATGAIQALGDRSEKLAATQQLKAGINRPAVLVRAMSYPDPRVQLAAAVAILRMPVGTNHGANAAIVDVLRRTIAGQDAGANATKGKAIIVDSNTLRGDRIASLLRSLGYDTEITTTGRELMKRVGQSSNFDLLVVDQHVVEPQLNDLLAFISASQQIARRPVAVVASADNPKPVGLEALLLRLAALIAATESIDIPVPAPLILDRRKPKEDTDRDRKLNTDDREKIFRQIYEGRLARTMRITDAANIVINAQLRSRLDLRLPQLTLAAIVAEYDPTVESAPSTIQNLANYTQLIRNQVDIDPTAMKVPLESLNKLIGQLETALTPELTKKFDAIRLKMDPTELEIARTPSLEPFARAKVAKQVKPYAGVTLIDEPYSSYALENDLKVLFSDPTQMPRDPTEKKAAAKLAIDYLRKLALGELPGYDIKTVETAFVQSLANDDLAEAAAESLARIPTATAQQELVKVAANPTRPVNLRVKAAEAAIQHVQTYSKLTSEPIIQQVLVQLAAEPAPEIKAKLAVVYSLITTAPNQLAKKIQTFTIPLPMPKEATLPPAKEGETPPADKPKN